MKNSALLFNTDVTINMINMGDTCYYRFSLSDVCINVCIIFQVGNAEDQSQAYKYLANYHIRRNRLDEAYVAAQKCTEFNEVSIAKF